MDNRRAFFGKFFAASSAVAIAAAQEPESQALIVVPQPGPVEIYLPKDMPTPIEYVHNGQFMTAEHINGMANAINRLNVAVFGQKL